MSSLIFVDATLYSRLWSQIIMGKVCKKVAARVGLEHGHYL